MGFASVNEGWAVGWYGYVAHTVNAGVSWQLQNIATIDDNILGLHALSPSEAYAVGTHKAPTTDPASVYHTTNAGATWTKIPVPNVDFLNNVFAIASDNVWTSGYHGAVLHQEGVSSTLQLLSAVSRQTHGAAGPFDISLPLSGAAGVECRDGRGSYSFVFNFSTSVVSGSASLSAGTGTAGTPVFAGTTMTVPLTGVTDVQAITVTLTDVTDTSSQVLPPTAVSAKMLLGDTNGNLVVDRTDVSLTRGQSGTPVGPGNFRQDMRINGTINSADVRVAREAQGHSLP